MTDEVDGDLALDFRRAKDMFWLFRSRRQVVLRKRSDDCVCGRLGSKKHDWNTTASDFRIGGAEANEDLFYFVSMSGIQTLVTRTSS